MILLVLLIYSAFLYLCYNIIITRTTKTIKEESSYLNFQLLVDEDRNKNRQKFSDANYERMVKRAAREKYESIRDKTIFLLNPNHYRGYEIHHGETAKYLYNNFNDDVEKEMQLHFEDWKNSESLEWEIISLLIHQRKMTEPKDKEKYVRKMSIHRDDIVMTGHPILCCICGNHIEANKPAVQIRDKYYCHLHIDKAIPY